VIANVGKAMKSLNPSKSLILPLPTHPEPSHNENDETSQEIIESGHKWMQSVDKEDQ